MGELMNDDFIEKMRIELIELEQKSKKIWGF